MKLRVTFNGQTTIANGTLTRANRSYDDEGDDVEAQVRVTLPRFPSSFDSSSYSLWVRGLMVTNVGFEFRDRSSIPSVCQITDDGRLHCTIAYTVVSS